MGGRSESSRAFMPSLLFFFDFSRQRGEGDVLIFCVSSGVAEIGFVSREAGRTQPWRARLVGDLLLLLY